MKIKFLFTLFFLILLSSCESEVFQIPDKPSAQIIYAGKPQEINYPNNLTILQNQGFIIAYDQKRLNPAWVAYNLFEVSPDTVSPKRPSSFREDERLRIQVSHRDYSHSGYDRGHMAPNYAIATRYGRQAQLQTFLMSNIAPQKHTLNAGIWEKLEKKIANDYANNLTEVWVFVGPIYEKNKPIRYLKRRKIQIPDAFFMIVIDEFKGQPRTLAFIMPQNVSAKEKSVQKFLVSIDQIETKTGFDFLSELEDNFENALEAKTEKEIWP